MGLRSPCFSGNVPRDTVLAAEVYRGAAINNALKEMRDQAGGLSGQYSGRLPVSFSSVIDQPAVTVKDSLHKLKRAINLSFVESNAAANEKKAALIQTLRVVDIYSKVDKATKNILKQSINDNRELYLNRSSDIAKKRKIGNNSSCSVRGAK